MEALLRGLPDTTADVLADYAKTPEDVLNSLAAGRGATAAGDCGALNVWKDDTGHIRCLAMRRMFTIGDSRYKDEVKVVRWWRRWEPRIMGND